MPTAKPLTIWGRANSVNVQKVLWCLVELDLGFRADRRRHAVWPARATPTISR